MITQTSVYENTKRLVAALKLRIGKEMETDFVCYCPLHKGGTEKHPSLWVSYVKPCYFCFACSSGGNLIDLVMSVKGWKDNRRFHQARIFVDEIGKFRYNCQKSNETSGGKDVEIPSDVLLLYGRGTYKWLGYSPKWLKKHDVYAGEKFILFGVRNLWGSLVGVVARKRDEKIDRAIVGDKKRLLLGAHQLRSRNASYAILVEGPKDYTKLVYCGWPNVLCVFGNGLTKEKAGLIAESGVKRVVVFYDNDLGGAHGYLNAYDRLKEFVIVSRVNYDTREKLSPSNLDSAKIEKLLGHVGIRRR